MSIVLTILLYIVTIVVFCSMTFVAEMLLAPIVWVYRGITGVVLLSPNHPVMVGTTALGAMILMFITRYVWAKLGYEVGWILISVLLLIHLFFGRAAGANAANRAQAYGVVYGLILFCLIELII